MHMTHENIAVLVKKEGLAQIHVIQDHEFHWLMLEWVYVDMHAS